MEERQTSAPMTEAKAVMPALRERMRQEGVPVIRLAIEANEYPNILYQALAGGRIGAKRLARITLAARNLGLLDDSSDTGETGE